MLTAAPGPGARTGAPAPRGESWLARDRAAITPAYHRYMDIVASHGQGSFLTDVEGRSCGCNDEVIRLVPPLNIEDEHLERGLQTIVDAVRSL
jgi:4-aminobutyrate aminotransferase-like enzyme